MSTRCSCRKYDGSVPGGRRHRSVQGQALRPKPRWDFWHSRPNVPRSTRDGGDNGVWRDVPWSDDIVGLFVPSVPSENTKNHAQLFKHPLNAPIASPLPVLISLVAGSLEPPNCILGNQLAKPEPDRSLFSPLPSLPLSSLPPPMTPSSSILPLPFPSSPSRPPSSPTVSSLPAPCGGR